MSKSEGFLEEFQKCGGAKDIAKLLAVAGVGAAAGGGGAYAYGEHKRKKHLKQLSDLFRQANVAENRMIAQRAFQAGRQGA